MRGEFIGVWAETWREIWLPLIDQPFGEGNESLAQDVFCELYRELAKALKMPSAAEAAVIVVEDAMTLREIFEGAARRSTDHELTGEQVEAAFKNSGASDETAVGKRMKLVVTTLTALVGKPATPFVDAQVREVISNRATVDGARHRTIERTINDQQKSRNAFENTRTEDLAGERAVVAFLESAYSVLEQYEEPGDDRLTNRYFNLLDRFVDKYSLRYDLRRPCVVCPTLPGMFSSLMRDLRALAARDGHLDELMKDFEESIRDLRIDCSERRIKTCIQKQINVLEALGRTYPRVKRKTLGAIAKQIASWPHEEVRAALQALYGFTCDFPGIRHGGTRQNALRAIEMRDMVALSILLVGFTPYLSNGLNPDTVYRGA